MKLPFPLLVLRFFHALAGSRSAFLTYFADAIPRGREVKASEVRLVRRNLMAVHWLIITGACAVLAVSTSVALSLIVVLLEGASIYGLSQLWIKGFGPHTLIKNPMIDELVTSMEELEAEFPAASCFIRVNGMKQAFTRFEMELLAGWTKRERILRDLGLAK